MAVKQWMCDWKCRWRDILFEIREKDEKNKNKNQMSFSSVPCQRWDCTVAHLKFFWHLIHLMMVCFGIWCAKCQIFGIWHTWWGCSKALNHWLKLLVFLQGYSQKEKEKKKFNNWVNKFLVVFILNSPLIYFFYFFTYHLRSMDTSIWTGTTK